MYYSKAQTDGSTCESSHSSRCLSQSDWLGDYLDVITFSGITVKIEKESDQELEGKCEVHLHDQKLEGKGDIVVPDQEFEGKCEVALHDLELGQCDIVVPDQELEEKCDVYVVDQELEGKGNVVVHDQELEGKCDVAGHDQELEGKCDVAVPDQELEEKCDVAVPDQELDRKCDVAVPDQELEGKCDIVVPDQELDGKCDVDVEEESYGFRIFPWMICLLVLLPSCASQPKGTKVVLHYNHSEQDVHITCSTNDSSFKIETMKVSGLNEETHYTISLGKGTTNELKYKIEDIGGVLTVIVRNFSEADQKYCYYCTIGEDTSACKYVTLQKNVDESCNNTGPPDQCKDPMSNCTEVSGDYKCSCNPGYYNNGGTCTAEINVDESCNNTRPPNPCKDPMSTCSGVSGTYKCTCNTGYYNNAGTCNIHEEDTGLSDEGIAGLIVGGFVFIAVCIALGCIYKKRKHICKREQDRIDRNVEEKVALQDKEPNGHC